MFAFMVLRENEPNSTRKMIIIRPICLTIDLLYQFATD